MLTGRLYDAGDPSLAQARVAARRLGQLFNSLDPDDVNGRDGLLRRLLGDIGEDSRIEAPFYCDYGTQVRLGSRVFVNMACVFLDAASIVLGDDVQLGPCVQLLTSDHPRDARKRSNGLESALPITIGARSWLGGGVIVLPGIEIGADVVVGAGSVVTTALEPGVMAAGNPCRVIRRA